MNKLFIIGIIAIIGVGIYYTGVYTYFIENKVSEEMPEAAAPIGQNKTQPAIKIVKQGEFTAADFLHKGSGQAKILEYPDGRKILRFENLETINGPDLFVYLSTTTAPTGDLENLGNYIDLGRLKGNVGNQNYDLPTNIDIGAYNSTIIWCKKFGVLFPYAILK